MDIDNSKLAAMVYAEMHKTVEITGRWRKAQSSRHNRSAGGGSSGAKGSPGGDADNV